MQCLFISFVLLCLFYAADVSAFALPKSATFACNSGDVLSVRTRRSPFALSSTIQKLATMRAGASKSVVEVTNQAQFSQLLKDAGKNKLVVADFTASWCGPCKMIAPIYQSMSEEFPNTIFTKVCLFVDVLVNVCDFSSINHNCHYASCSRLTWTRRRTWHKNTPYNRCPHFCSLRTEA